MKFTSPYADLFKKDNKRVKEPKETRVRFEIALDSVRDKDLIEHLNSVPNKSEYVRELIREDIDAY